LHGRIYPPFFPEQQHGAGEKKQVHEENPGDNACAHIEMPCHDGERDIDDIAVQGAHEDTEADDKDYEGLPFFIGYDRFHESRLPIMRRSALSFENSLRIRHGHAMQLFFAYAAFFQRSDDFQGRG
jgi:hypothetical protein